MTAAFLISFREGLEAALIIGIILSYLKKIDSPDTSARYVWAGVLTAISLSIVSAIALQAFGVVFEGQLEEIFEGVTMLLAAGVLTWMIFWMRHQARFLKTSLEKQILLATRTKALWGLAGVSFFAVLREGIETALFLSAAAFATDGHGTLAGASLGLLAALVTGYLIYASAAHINLQQFFNITSLLLLLFAAGLVAHGVHEFQEAGVLITLRGHLWDMNSILDENSILGELLKTLVGYNANPSLLEVLAYWAYWILVLLGLRRWTNSNAELEPSTP